MKDIIKGYSNALLRTNQEVEILAKKRMQVCFNCPLLKKKIGVFYCGACGCPLVAKTRQNHKICIKWKNIH